MKASSGTQLAFAIRAGADGATCLHLLNHCAEGETITTTNQGKVVTRLGAVEPETEKPFRSLLGRMKDEITIHGDMVGPDFNAWKMRR